MKEKIALITLVIMLFGTFKSFADDGLTQPISANELDTRETAGGPVNYLSLSIGAGSVFTGLVLLGSTIELASENYATPTTVFLSGLFFLGWGMDASAQEMDEVIEKIKETDRYQFIRSKLGEEATEEFLQDYLAGWSVEKLDEKYPLK